MRILIAHNAYQQRGGEDVVAEAEAEMLRNNGHEVFEYRRHNDELKEMSKAQAMADALWSRRTVAEVTVLIRKTRPDILHVHNTFPLISPSIYWAAEAERVPVVQTLHNFRLLCPQAMFLRDGLVCEDCLGKTPWPAVLHACYRQSRAQSAGVLAMLTLHRGIGTWSQKVARFIALSEFGRRKFVEGGLPAARIVIKPNFVQVPTLVSQERSGFLFVGRLSPEKGISVLAEAARLVPDASINVAGVGPSSPALDGIHGIRQLGQLTQREIQDILSRSIALIVPSLWYETFGLVVLEAFACATPVIASRIGTLEELVSEKVTGLLFEPGNAEQLAAKLAWAKDHRIEMDLMGQRARDFADSKYSAIQNYEMLLGIYRSALESGEQLI